MTRLRPFIGNIGTTPAIDMPDSHNAGDFGQFLLGAPHKYGITKDQLENRTDGHLDIDSAQVPMTWLKKPNLAKLVKEHYAL